jgi:hypothetical protein
METWRSIILKEFVPQAARLTIVSDPDSLITEEIMAGELRNRGFEIIEYIDSIAFRYAYESRYRSKWDNGEATELIVILRTASPTFEELPFDLLQTGRILSFSLTEIFPNLCYPIVRLLAPKDLDVLYNAQSTYNPGTLGENATKDFVLRHVFGVAPEFLKDVSDLLKMLLHRHYIGQSLPEILDKRLINLLRRNPVFSQWPLEQIIPDKRLFFTFLQERWATFLDKQLLQREPRVNENSPKFQMRIPGPLEIPFDHEEIRIYIDNLFAEGFLHPISHKDTEYLEKQWMRVGIHVDSVSDIEVRFKKLCSIIEESFSEKDARHDTWFKLAFKWSEILCLLSSKDNYGPSLITSFEDLKQTIDEKFNEWVVKKFSSLYNLPPNPPVMLHHLPGFMASLLGSSSSTVRKISLLIIDGLALDQWVILRDELQEVLGTTHIQESCVFSWVPSITSISRQSAFSGTIPLYFPSSILTTNQEQKHWAKFWTEFGLPFNSIGYMKGSDEEILTNLKSLEDDSDIRVLGLVIDTVDRIMHGMELGMAGMHSQIRLWGQKGRLAEVIKHLLQKNFKIILSSDHGNVEATGIGRPSEGCISDVRGERVRIFTDPKLRTLIKNRFPEAHEWDSTGLPEGIFPLLAPARTAFIPRGTNTMAHGGISIEELIVPFIQIEEFNE